MKKIIEMDGFRLTLIKNLKYKTVGVNFKFISEIDRENLTNKHLGLAVLIQGTKNIKSKREIDIECEKNFDQGLNYENSIMGNYQLITVKTSFINSKFLNLENDKRFLDFAFDILLNPDATDSFNNKNFEFVKAQLKDSFITDIENKSYYANLNAKKLAFSSKNAALQSVGSLEQLEKSTSKDAYREYKKMINNNVLEVYVIGDIDFEFYEEYFKFWKRTPDLKVGDLVETQDITEVKEEILKDDANQSHLLMYYKIDEVTELERFVVSYLYNKILGSLASSKLFVNVREKNSLCYTTYSTINLFNMSMKIYAGINSSDFEKAKKAILEQVEEMSKNVTEEELAGAIKNFENSIILSVDRTGSIISAEFFERYYNEWTNEEILEVLKKITVEDIYEFSKKIHLDTIFLLEGGANNA